MSSLKKQNQLKQLRVLTSDSNNNFNNDIRPLLQEFQFGGSEQLSKKVARHLKKAKKRIWTIGTFIDLGTKKCFKKNHLNI